MSESRKVLDEYDAFQLLEQAGIAVVPTKLVCSQEQLAEAAREIGFPLVCKISAAGLAHKTEIGGVKVGITDMAELQAAWDSIMEQALQASVPRQDIRGVLLQPMISGGTECIIGGMRNDSFGPVVMFGLGGVTAEVYQDVSFRLAPLRRIDAESMIADTSASVLLSGYRGAAKGDVEALADLLVAVGTLIAGNERILELDMNPVVVQQRKVAVLDAMLTVSC